MNVLSVQSVSVSYGGVHALSEVSLEVGQGRLVGLIGPNGAGKTTFVDAVTGLVTASGRVELDGRDLTGLPPHMRARRGLARTFQSSELFEDLTVVENLQITADRPSWWRAFGETLGRRVSPDSAAAEALAALGLEDLAHASARQLSQGQRKLVGVARALAARPRVVCLDEPAAGLDTAESAELGRRLRAVADDGTSLLLIDHDMSLVMGICDHVVVLEFGKVIASGPPARVRTDPAVVTAYLGASAVRPTAASRQHAGTPSTPGPSEAATSTPEPS
ncbi:ABC transporter ATP-binding protein [Streptomyces sp. DSM 15324]|uniref:ABC transporter ATP-binding protein n=1 Tax=Streptomyces sp. DSM 15324 TaxID=1739111 RepID=UPI00074821EA|nr:ABC transporter ATP-binding protein [Streptomyces sp. DSM 15324]KUO07391.1 ABC transporter ATP-binding protein [Streptomyces sp. DSM 15324]